MQRLRVNGYDMAFIELGPGPALICVHGTLGDFRTWSAVLGPLSKTRRVISVSLRRFFPEHWNGFGHDYLMSQHVDDVIAFIQQIKPGPVDLMGHSRGGHVAFRVAQRRPDLLRKLILAEPGGELDGTFDASNSAAKPGSLIARLAACAGKVRAGDIDGALADFVDVIDGEGAWASLPETAKQQLRDNAFTLIGQANENRKPYSRADAESIRTPTLFIGGAETKGALAQVLRTLSVVVPGARTAMIKGARHWMFDHAPQEYSRIVLEFLAA